ncbi:serine protease [Methylobacterium sp. Leaf102]|uniref:CAP domain-containing protein n=1 Tax=unclassified Methylobacterium TaxID=2615210 RepID=UPI0006FA40D8|nr:MULTISPECIES: CAP domain-containing protein [unclassified Methylobacterium]KQP23718.1 serine protease [Methylobacterium sp. Leaf102]KQP31967.1 serine protease [Methylobacterium sp. Leaf100]KQP58691.1 serine protease [Methylobacterium sp. Leaf112]
MPKLSSRAFAYVVAASVAVTLAGCSAPTLLGPDTPTSVVILDEQAAAAAISRYRAQHGLGPVVIDTSLIRAASYQAASNAKAGRLSHEIGGTFDARMAEAGFGRAYAAENLSAGSNTFDEVLARWKSSPEHNKNMLMPQLKRVGIARVDAPGTRYKRFWALVLAGG